MARHSSRGRSRAQQEEVTPSHQGAGELLAAHDADLDGDVEPVWPVGRRVELRASNSRTPGPRDQARAAEGAHAPALLAGRGRRRRPRRRRSHSSAHRSPRHRQGGENDLVLIDRLHGSRSRSHRRRATPPRCRRPARRDGCAAGIGLSASARAAPTRLQSSPRARRTHAEHTGDQQAMPTGPGTALR